MFTFCRLDTLLKMEVLGETLLFRPFSRIQNYHKKKVSQSSVSLKNIVSSNDLYTFPELLKELIIIWLLFIVFVNSEQISELWSIHFLWATCALSGGMWEASGGIGTDKEMYPALCCREASLFQASLPHLPLEGFSSWALEQGGEWDVI